MEAESATAESISVHYNVELKDNSVDLNEEGVALAEMVLETNDLWDENDPWARFVMNAFKAKEFYHRDVQYIIRNGMALIIKRGKCRFLHLSGADSNVIVKLLEIAGAFEEARVEEMFPKPLSKK